MSSMTTPITLLANQNSVDIERAVEMGISTKTIEGKVVLESVGIADTGADFAVCDTMFRNILGREPLQDATVNIHGCTGTSNNKNKDKLRIVTSDKEVTVIETRQVPELGYSGPGSDTFKRAVKAELGITAKNENKFDFNDSNVIPRILIGLKSGELLAEKLNVNQLLEKELDLAFFSPDLTVWKTAQNTLLQVN